MFSRKILKSEKYIAVNNKEGVSRLKLKDHKHNITESVVNLSTSFIPITPVYTPEELANVDKLEKELEEKKKKFEANPKREQAKNGRNSKGMGSSRN